MGEDDVICLSSDDEVPQEKLRQTNVNINNASSSVKIELVDMSKNLKRKNSENRICYGKKAKKTKISKDDSEETMVQSSVKDANKDNRLSNSRLDVRKDLTGNGTIIIRKVLNKHTKSGDSEVNPLVQNEMEKQVANNNLKEPKVVLDKMRNIVINPAAKLKMKELISNIGTTESTSKLLHTHVGSSTTNCSNQEKTPPREFHGGRTSRESSESPEILILPDVIVPKVTKPVFNKVDTKTPVPTITKPSLKSGGETTLPIDNSISSNPKTTQRQIPRVTNCQILKDNLQKDVLSSTANDSFGRLKQTYPALSKTSNDNNDSRISPPKSAAPKGGAPASKDKSSLKRIKPLQLSLSLKESKKSGDIVSETLQDSNSSSRSNENNAKIVNEISKGTSRVPENSTDAKGSKPTDFEPTPGCSKFEDFEPTPGCSKTPDEKRKDCLSKSPPPKRESVSLELSDKKEIADTKIPESSEQELGGSKLADEADKKPCLVVVNKTPVLHETDHDTFSMFLSLCLQTDRSPDMEKVVEKLKRYYEELNPAYAASQEFRDTLNQKRDYIMRKGKKAVYHYVQLLKKDMKARKRINKPGTKDASQVEYVEVNPEDARRIRNKVKKIEKAMKLCQKMIKKYEEEEMDFGDENNSSYIKSSRCKEKMIQLYTQMCKYTKEHPDAGRAYLRPKHLRVTQIPAIDQAINSFVNSKLSMNIKKVARGKSFVDGLIFPDYVDILECVEKVNKEQDLNLSKRNMQNLAEHAFTQLGKHLQSTRRSDYWDTFSLILEDSIDPAIDDTDLAEKLARNKETAEANEKKVFEEYVRKQEEGKGCENEEETEEEEEDEDGDENQEEDDNEKDETLPSLLEGSDGEMSINEVSDRESESEKDNVKTTSSDKDAKDHNNESQNTVVTDDTNEVSKDENRKTSEEKQPDKGKISPSSTPQKSDETEAEKIQVTLDDVETEEGKSEPEKEDKPLQQPLRIRSFAKPPETWNCSQEVNEQSSENNGKNVETPENTDDEISVVSFTPKERKTQNVTGDEDSSAAMMDHNLTNMQSIKVVSALTNSTNVKHSGYLLLSSLEARPFQMRVAGNPRAPNQPQTVKIAIPRVPSFGEGAQLMRFGIPAASSTPIQPQLAKKVAIPPQHANRMRILRVNKDKGVISTTASRVPVQSVAVATTSTPLQPLQITRPMSIQNQGVKIQPRTLSPLQQTSAIPKTYQRQSSGARQSKPPTPNIPKVLQCSPRISNKVYPTRAASSRILRGQPTENKKTRQ